MDWDCMNVWRQTELESSLNPSWDGVLFPQELVAATRYPNLSPHLGVIPLVLIEMGVPNHLFCSTQWLQCCAKPSCKVCGGHDPQPQRRLTLQAHRSDTTSSGSLPECHFSARITSPCAAWSNHWTTCVSRMAGNTYMRSSPQGKHREDTMSLTPPKMHVQDVPCKYTKAFRSAA